MLAMLRRSRTPRPSSSEVEGRGLEVKNVSVSFNGLIALADVDIRVEEGEILGLIGPNGAGKTTMVNIISGHYTPDSGQVLIAGKDVTGQPPDWICRQGLGRTFQRVRLFPELTVEENVEAAALKSARGQKRRSTRHVARELLAAHGLHAVAHLKARTLPHGDQRRLGLVRALATRPSFLLLDEPAAGLNESETEEMLHTIASIREDRGCGVLVIEHDMGLIMRLCDRIQVLNGGRTICIGTPDEVTASPEVIEAYLGSDPDEAALQNEKTNASS